MHAFQGDIFDKGEWVLEFHHILEFSPKKSKFMMYVYMLIFRNVITLTENVAI